MSKIIAAFVTVACLASPQSARSAVITYQLSEATASPGGNQVLVNVTLDDEAVPGSILATMSVVDNPAIAGTATGDLRGFYFNTAADSQSFLNGLVFSGADVSDSLAQTNNVTSLPPPNEGANVNPLGPFDVGIAIGSAGIGDDDIPTTTILISHAGGPIDLSLFPTLLQDPAFLAVRVTSIGLFDGRDASGKFGGPGDPPNIISFPPPNPVEHHAEPASLLVWLGVLGAASAGWARRRSMRRR